MNGGAAFQFQKLHVEDGFVEAVVDLNDSWGLLCLKPCHGAAIRLVGKADGQRQVVVSAVFSLGLHPTGLQTTGRLIEKAVLGVDQSFLELVEKLVGRVCLILLRGGEVKITGETAAVVANGLQQTAFHDHAGLQVT